MSRIQQGVEKSAKVGRELFDLNNSAMVRIAELSAANFKRYLELNQNYVSKLPEVRDVSSFVELQRDYSQNLWEGVQSDLKARGEIVRETVENTGSIVRGVFSESDETVEEEASVVKAA